MDPQRAEAHGGRELLCMSDLSEFIHFFPRHLLFLTLREKTLGYMDILSDSEWQLLHMT